MIFFLQAAGPPVQLEPVDLSVKTPVVLQVPRYSPAAALITATRRIPSPSTTPTLLPMLICPSTGKFNFFISFLFIIYKNIFFSYCALYVFIYIFIMKISDNYSSSRAYKKSLQKKKKKKNWSLLSKVERVFARLRWIDTIAIFVTGTWLEFSFDCLGKE